MKRVARLSTGSEQMTVRIDFVCIPEHRDRVHLSVPRFYLDVRVTKDAPQTNCGQSRDQRPEIL